MNRYCPNDGSKLVKTIEDYERGVLWELQYDCPICDYKEGEFEGKRWREGVENEKK